MIKGKKTGQEDGNYTKIPNNILKARNLSSNAVRVLGLLIDRQSALDSAGKLRDDNLFYMVASAFDDAMDISGTQVQRTILPELESKGLITRHRCPQDADSVYRRYTFYSLNWDRIYTYDGSQKDVTKEAKRKAKERKAQEALRARQALEDVTEVVTEAFPEVIAEAVTEPVAKTSETDRLVLKALAETLHYGCIEDMMQLDWDYPERESEQHFFFMDMFKKFALHRLGYISLDYDNALYKVVTLFAEWDRCSEGIARIKVECKIKAIEDTLTKVIKSLQDV
jgi:hypothetical protein